MGYLAYAGLNRVWRGETPNAPSTVALAIGTQFPDLVDKPLSWTFELLPTGRSLAHSALVAALITVLVIRYARSVDRPLLGNGFAVGYWSHLFADLFSAVVAGDAETNWFFLWPLVPQDGYVTTPSFLGYIDDVGWYGLFVLGYVGVFAVFVALLRARTAVDDHTVSLVVAGLVATSVWFVVTVGSGSVVTAFELALVQFAVAAWIHDGAPGLPYLRPA